MTSKAKCSIFSDSIVGSMCVYICVVMKISTYTFTHRNLDRTLWWIRNLSFHCHSSAVSSGICLSRWAQHCSKTSMTFSVIRSSKKDTWVWLLLEESQRRCKSDKPFGWETSITACRVEWYRVCLFKMYIYRLWASWKRRLCLSSSPLA